MSAGGKGMLSGLRIGLLTSSASRLGGGVFEAVVAQAEMIRMQGGEAAIFALADRHSEDDRGRLAPSEAAYFEVAGPDQIGFAPDLAEALLAAELDCLHQQGIWMYPTRAAAVWARRTRRPYVITPQGMLDPWITRRSRWKKAIARIAYEEDAWRRAAFFHALSNKEARDIERETGRSDSLVLPNVGPPAIPAPKKARAPHIVYIGRIHPKKNLLALVEAWKNLPDTGAARLTIAGWGSEEDVADLRAALADAPASARYVGPIFGEEKQQLLESASFTVLPTLSEGLPLSILDSWAAAAPSIMTEEANIPEGFAANAAIECGYVAQTIVPALARAIAMPDGEWLAMSKAAHRLATGPFSAAKLAARWAEAYTGAIAAKAGGTQRPA